VTSSFIPAVTRPQPTTIYKYPVAMEDSFTLDLPVGSRPLSVQAQRGEPMLWVAITDSTRRERHRFYLRGTGHPLGEAKAERFIGTFQLENMGLVFHLFDGGPEEFET
jgi:hypothetical protein